jgi:hypothetical protein
VAGGREVRGFFFLSLQNTRRILRDIKKKEKPFVERDFPATE